MQKQTQPAEPVRKANGSIWDNHFFLGIVSVLAAVLVWMVVSTFWTRRVPLSSKMSA